MHARFLESLDVETTSRMLNSFAQTMRRHAGHVEKDGTDRTERQPLTDDEASLLADVADHQVSPVTERYERLGLSPKRGTHAAAAVVDRGLLKAVTVPVPGSHVRLLELTPSGRLALGLSASVTDRHGGLEHRYWVEKIAEGLAGAGFAVTTEAPIGHGKSVDLLVALGKGERITVEVETGRSNWRSNVRKCLDANIDIVIVATTQSHLRTPIHTASRLLGSTERIRVLKAAEVPSAVSLLVTRTGTGERLVQS